jgi:V8-like Glu-specific endopeptidase
LAIAVAGSTAALLGPTPAATAAGSSAAVARDNPAIRQVPSTESRSAQLQAAKVAKIATTAKPLALPTNVPLAKGLRTAPESGTALSVKGTAPHALSAVAGRRSQARLTTNGALWPGSNTSNPNAQIGKLYFDVDPGPAVDQHWCTGTAVNSGNKSLVLTAGHCVYDVANRRWYTNSFFVPGYENGQRPFGTWTVRVQSTTRNYFDTGASADDMAAVVVNRSSAGVALVNQVGGHGISFNQPVNQFRTSFGYPITDSRWPGWVSSGEDMYYCQGVDTYFSTGSFAGQMLLSCRMTGGASGGPWLTNVQSNWLGYAQSVNSNKGGIGAAWAGLMFGPYMDGQEAAVYQAVGSI